MTSSKRSAPQLVSLCISLMLMAAGWPAIAAGPGGASDTAKSTIKIGFITSLSGVAAHGATDMVNGIKLFLEQNHYQLSGHKIELIVENDESSAATAVAKLRKLVEQDKVDIIDGILLSNIAYVIAQRMDAYHIPAIIALSAADDITQRKRAKWVLRTGWCAGQAAMPFGEYAYKTLGYRKIATFGLDFPLGWELVGGFQQTFEAAGGKIIQRIWGPLGFTDFSEQLKKLRPDADAVFMATANQPAELIPKQYQQTGLKMPILAGGPAYDEVVLRHLGDEAQGAITCFTYSPALNTQVNKAFVKAYTTAFHERPSHFAESSYTSGMWIAKALEATHGDVTDKTKLLAALRAVELQAAPRGPVKLDAYGNPIENVYVTKIEKVNGKLQNTVIYTFPNVSQFWKSKPEEYLKQPIYSKDFPPCKNCAH